MLGGDDRKLWEHGGGFFKVLIFYFFVQVQFSNRIANGSISVNIPGGDKIMKEIKKLNIELFAFYMLST